MTRQAVVVQGLRIVTADGRRCLVDDGCLDLAAGEVLGVVGESGSGKTTLGLALLNHCRRGLRIDGGAVRIDGRDLCAEPAESLRRVRGRVVCYVPQDPASALNPALKIGTQLAKLVLDGANVLLGVPAPLRQPLLGRGLLLPQCRLLLPQCRLLLLQCRLLLP